jgi:L-ascorbate metabolism protein UlaG (beta-lactamase superfamily)
MPDADAPPPDAPGRLLWGGHATVRIELDGAALLTDPVLRGHLAHLRRRGPVPAGLTDGLDAVLISHLHRDHLDRPSLRHIPPEVPIVVPAGGATLLPGRERSVIEVVPGDELELGGVSVLVTEALHDGGRTPIRPRGIPALGYLLRGSRRVYFAGDTDVFPGMAGLAPGLDVALLPVWGWGPKLGAGHMDPVRAAEALELLRPRVAVPIHWATLYPGWMRGGSLSFLDAPGPAFAAAAAERAPDVAVRIVAPGGSLALGAPPA